MADHENLFNFLTENELQNLPEGVQTKIATQLTSSKGRIEELEISVERLGVDADQKYFELEKQYITSNILFEEEAKKCRELNEKLKDFTTKQEEQVKRISQLEEQLRDAEVIKVKLESTSNNLNLEKGDLSSQLEKKLKEIDNLQDEWQQMSEKIGSSNSSKLEAQTKLEEIKSKEMTLQYQQQRLEQEKEQLARQNSWLEDELSKKSDELFTIRRDLSSRVLELNRSLNEKTEELARSEETRASLKESTESQSKKMDDYLERLREMRESEMKQEEQVKKELQARDKLINLYKTSLEEQDKKSQELLSAVEELQKVVHNANDVAKQAVEERDSLQNEMEITLGEKVERITDLEKELDVANGMIATGRKKGAIPLSADNIEAMSPTAAAASKLLKSGKTLTQIYSEYVTATEALQMEKMENNRLNQYLDRILQDIEEKAPRMKKQREDYEQALQTINHLTSQLDGAMNEVEKLRHEADDSTRRCNQFQRDTHRLNQQAADLGRQVKYLIKEMEEARGTRVTTVHDDADVSSGEVTSSSMIITERLVTFRSIEEMQEQNQRLLQVVRELSQKNEDDERKAVDDKTSAIQKELELVKSKLDEQASSRTRQAELFESVVRQRDMYSVLLAQSNTGAATLSMYPTTPLHASTPRPGYRPPGTPAGGVPDSPGDQSGLNQARDALKQLRDEYDGYKKDRQDNDKMLSEQVDSLKKDLSEMRVQNAKLSSQLDYSLERFKIVQGNSESYKKEIAAIREKNQQYTASIIKHEQAVNQLREDLMAMQTKLTRTDVEAQNLKSQLNLAKSTEARLLQERETMHREHHSQTVLMANLQAIQNNLERQEFVMKTKMGGQLAALEKECTELRRKVAASEGEHKAIRDMMQARLDETARKVQEQTELHNNAEGKLKILQDEKSKLQQDLLATEGRLSVSDARISKLTQDPKLAAQETAAQDETLHELQAKVENLLQEQREQSLKLSQAREHCEQYQQIAQSIEESLKEQNQASDEFKRMMEERMELVQKENDVLSTRCQNFERECHDRLQENIKISEESHNLNAELRKCLSTAQTELEEAVSRREEAIKQEHLARDDCQKQVEVAREAQDKYERELVLHAADMETMRATKAELSGFNMKLVKAEAEARSSHAELEALKQAWSEQEKQKTEEYKKLEARYIELTDQNEVLHEQMEKLSNQVVNVQLMSSGDKSALDISFSEDSAKSSEQLMEVIRFLRREKEIADTKFQVTSAENSRLCTRISALTKQVDDLTESMVEERESTQVSIATAMEHSDLMKKVENLNLLTDSNKLMREEKERLMTQLRETENKLRKLEEDTAPLQSNIRDLQAQVDASKQEKVSLQSEVARWKLRVNNLIEQSDKTDPEERKRLMNEKEEAKKELNKAKEELAQSELVRTDLSNKLSSAKEESTRWKAELSRNASIHNNALAAKTNEITQVKQQIEKLSKETKTMKETHEKELKLKSDKLDENTSLINQLKRLGRKYKLEVELKDKVLAQLRKDKESRVSSESEQTSLNEQRVTELTATVDELRNRNEELERQKQASDTAHSSSEDNLRTLTSELEEMKRSCSCEALHQSLSQTRNELTEAQLSVVDLNKTKTELERKLEIHKDMLQKVKTKITSQKTEIDELKKMNAGQGTDGSDVEKVRASYQTQIAQLNLQNEQLGEKVCEMSKYVEAKSEQYDDLQMKYQELQSRGPAVTKVTPAQVDRAIKSVTKATPRANIQPMSSPSPTAARQSAPVQPTSRATASIRPMAMASHSPAPSTSTPTATVMPLQDQGPDSEPEPSPSTSRQPGPPCQQNQANKRPREDSLDSSIEPDRMKRSKQEMESETSALDDSAVELEQPGAPVQEVHPRVSEPVSETMVEEQGNMRVTIVLSDEESAEDMVHDPGTDEVGVDDEEGGEEEMEDSIEDEEEIEGDLGEEDPVDVESFGSEEAAEAEESGEEESEEGAEGDSDVEEEEEDEDDVVIIDDENDDQRDEGVQEAAVQESAPPISIVAQFQAQIQAQTQAQAQARSQLPSFTFSGPGAGFEEGDDCRVPGTPTISLPPRNDGFAEVNSPERGQGHGHVFPYMAEEGVQQSQLQVQEGVGVDDTKVDLSSYDEPSEAVIEEDQEGLDEVQTGEEHVVEEDISETLFEVEDLQSAGTEIQEKGASGDQALDDEAGTSRDPQSSTQDDGKQSQARRIEPIIWEEPARPAPAPPQATPQAQPIASLAPSRPQMTSMMIPQPRQRAHVQGVQGRGQTPGRGMGRGQQRVGPQLRQQHQGRPPRARGRGSGRGMYRSQPF